jgi:ribosomal protein S18
MCLGRNGRGIETTRADPPSPPPPSACLVDVFALTRLYPSSNATSSSLQIVEPEAFRLRSAFAREPPRPPRAILGPSKQDAQLIDPFFRLAISPLHEYKNARLLCSFTTDTGRIKGRAETGLTWKSQRQVGAAIRRARVMGMMHRWQNKDPFEEKGVPWAEEEARELRARRDLPLQARLSALGRPGGMGRGELLQITGFQKPKEEPVEGGVATGPAIEAPKAPKGAGVFGLAETSAQ